MKYELTCLVIPLINNKINCIQQLSNTSSLIKVNFFLVGSGFILKVSFWSVFVIFFRRIFPKIIDYPQHKEKQKHKYKNPFNPQIRPSLNTSHPHLGSLNCVFPKKQITKKLFIFYLRATLYSFHSPLRFIVSKEQASNFSRKQGVFL